MKPLFACFLWSVMGCVSTERYDAAIAELTACKDDAAAQKAAPDVEKARADLADQVAQLGSLVEQATGEDPRKGAASFAAATEKLRSDVERLRRSERSEKARNQMLMKLVGKLSDMIEAAQLSVYTRKGRMLVKIPDVYLFAPGRAALLPGAGALLSKVTAALETVEGYRLQVADHTDNTPIHTAQFASNWELSTARALAVTAFLVKDGMNPHRLSAAGFADGDPILPNETIDGKRINNRIEIEILPNLDEDQGGKS